MALPTLDATFASSADLPRKQMLAKWLVSETGETFPSNVLISGFEIYGNVYPNGIYSYEGIVNGKPSYRYFAPDIEDPNVLKDFFIQWTSIEIGEDTYDVWLLNGDYIGIALAISYNDTQYPWDATWETFDAGDQIPVVTESPAPSALSNYYDLPERYLWAKIAVAAGGPKTEADYISLPKNYAWSDIYNAVSGDIANSTVVVSGLSDGQLNGSYVYDGDVNSKPSYRFNANVHIFWDASPQHWVLFEDEGGTFAYSQSNTAYPWLASNWINDGIDPSNIVLTPQTPNHTDWSENVALGHIAAAYRGDTGNPANLATYIDWPWRYKVASIIVSL